MVKKPFALLVLIFGLGCLLFAQTDYFKQGEDLFLRNHPQEALAFLQKAASEPGGKSLTAGLYLAMAYEQLGRQEEAIAQYRKMLPQAGDKTALVAYNLGNAYFNKGTASFAEQYYTKAIEADPSLASAYLNRANTRIKTGALKDAIPDYELYLTLEPASPKRAQIEKLVALIKNEEAEAERKKIAAEQAAKAEAERKQRLLEEVATSLQETASETEGFSAGSESVSGYDSEFELE